MKPLPDKKRAFPRQFKTRVRVRVKKQGLCENCTRPVRKGHTRCVVCAAAVLEFNKGWRQRRVDARLCINCGTPRTEDETAYRCKICTARDVEKNKGRKDLIAAAWAKRTALLMAAGICVRCKGPVVGRMGKQSCAACAEKSNKMSQKWRDQKREAAS